MPGVLPSLHRYFFIRQGLRHQSAAGAVADSGGAVTRLLARYSGAAGIGLVGLRMASAVTEPPLPLAGQRIPPAGKITDGFLPQQGVIENSRVRTILRSLVQPLNEAGRLAVSAGEAVHQRHDALPCARACARNPAPGASPDRSRPNLLAVTKPQAKAWLARLVETSVLEKVAKSKPVRYRTTKAEERLQ